MTNSHSISITFIQTLTFVNTFANFDPRIMILSFLDSSQSGILKTVQNPFLGVLEGEKLKKKVCIKLVETNHSKFSLHFPQ